jgi:WD40 repeat protein
MFKLSEVENYVLPDQIINLVWIKSEKMIAAGLLNGEIVLFSHETKTIVHKFKEHKGKVTGLTLCEFNGKPTLVSCSKDNTVKLYNIAEHTLLSSIPCYNTSNYYPREVIYCHDGKSLITTHGDGKFFIFDYLKKEKKKYFFSNESSVTAAVYVGDSNTFIVGNKNGNVDFFVAK